MTTTTIKTNYVSQTVATLTAAGIKITERRPLPTGHGLQLVCGGGAIVTVWRTGTRLAQGKGADRVKVILAAAPLVKAATSVDQVKQAAPDTAAAPNAQAEVSEETRAAPPGWTTEPWDGETLPWE